MRASLRGRTWGADAGTTPPGASLAALRAPRTSGQGVVEFALVSTIFCLLVFGTIDFGRVIFAYSELHNAVREGARFGKVQPTNTVGIRNRVIARALSLDLAAGDITVSCTGGCVSGTGEMTVQATTTFSAITQELLGIGPITLTSQATVKVE